jgi:hypothetical protein
MVVRAEFPILFLHLKMPFSAQCPLSLHIFSRQVGRRCGALEVHLPQDSSGSSRLATELTADAPEFEEVLGQLFMLVVLHVTCKPCWRCEPKIPPCSTLNLDRCKAARCVVTIALAGLHVTRTLR